MLIRPETPQDAEAIFELTQAAFAPKGFSDGTEGAIIAAMRQSGDLTLSLVAEDEGEIIGHVAFSPATISDSAGDWYGLGPISVREDCQRQGIGRKLTNEGLTRLKAGGAAGCALTGDPAIYTRFGFISNGLRHAGTKDHCVLWQSFSGAPARGTVTFAPALDG